MYYLQSRYYSPDIGRFINADVLLSGIGESVLGCNTFSYCINNPVNMHDPKGFRQAMYVTSTAWPNNLPTNNSTGNKVTSIIGFSGTITKIRSETINNEGFWYFDATGIASHTRGERIVETTHVFINQNAPINTYISCNESVNNQLSSEIGIRAAEMSLSFGTDNMGITIPIGSQGSTKRALSLRCNMENLR